MHRNKADTLFQEESTKLNPVWKTNGIYVYGLLNRIWSQKCINGVTCELVYTILANLGFKIDAVVKALLPFQRFSKINGPRKARVISCDLSNALEGSTSPPNKHYNRDRTR